MRTQDIPVGHEHPNHPGWKRVDADSSFSLTFRDGRGLDVTVSMFELLAGNDIEAELARLIIADDSETEHGAHVDGERVRVTVCISDDVDEPVTLLGCPQCGTVRFERVWP